MPEHLDVVVDSVERHRAADVVGVAVGVDDVGDRRVRPALDRVDDRSTRVGVRGVEGNQAVARVDHDAVTERLDDGEPVGHLAQLVRDPVERFVDVAALDDRRRQFEQVVHPHERYATSGAPSGVNAGGAIR